MIDILLPKIIVEHKIIEIFMKLLNTGIHLRYVLT